MTEQDSDREQRQVSVAEGDSASSTATSCFCCPECHGGLEQAPDGAALRCRQCNRAYPVVSGVPDFVGARDDFYEGKFVGARAEGIGDRSWGSTAVGRLANWLWRLISISARRQRFISRTIPFSNQSILDLACGGGTRTLLGRGRVVGIDISLVSALAARPDYAATACADAFKLPVPAASFDCVFSSDFFGHVPHGQKDRLFLEVRRCLKPAGRLVFVAETDSVNPLTAAAKRHPKLYREKFVEEIGGHYGLELPSALDARLRRAGFRRLRLTKIYSVLWPVQTYSRMFDGGYSRQSCLFRVLAFISRCLSSHRAMRHAVNCVLGVTSDLVEAVLPLDWGVGVCGVYARSSECAALDAGRARQ